MNAANGIMHTAMGMDDKYFSLVSFRGKRGPKSIKATRAETIDSH